MSFSMLYFSRAFWKNGGKERWGQNLFRGISNQDLGPLASLSLSLVSDNVTASQFAANASTLIPRGRAWLLSTPHAKLGFGSSFEKASVPLSRTLLGRRRFGSNFVAELVMRGSQASRRAQARQNLPRPRSLAVQLRPRLTLPASHNLWHLAASPRTCPHS